MYAFSPLVGSISDRVGKQKTIRIGFFILLASTLISGTAAADNVPQLGIGLFLLGLGWSFTLIAGSTLLSSSVDETLKTSTQGTSDLMMNLSGAIGGAIAGLIIASLNYTWLCIFAAIPVVVLLFWSFKLKEEVIS
jgi:MFS family permease